MASLKYASIVDIECGLTRLQHTVLHHKKNMSWGCFSFHGTGTRTHLDEMMNRTKYIDVLVRKMLPEFKKCYPDGSGVFPQDQVSCHSSGDDVFVKKTK